MKRKSSYRHTSLLPIDDRLIPNIFSFSHVHGIARVFLLTEIILSTLVVIGSVIRALLYVIAL